MKDYYSILGISPSSDDDQIRRNYRKLAMRYHPDRNPDDPEAEARFKEVAEAYGVLTDPVKRREYDQCRGMGGMGGKSGNTNFSYSQEDILKDLFQDPRFQQMFSNLLQEFQRSGFRHSAQFVRKSFFGGKGGIFMGGIVFLGSLAGPLITQGLKKKLPKSDSFMRTLGRGVGNLISMAKNRGDEVSPPTPPHQEDLDITYHTPLTREELRSGKNIHILVYGSEGEQTLRITIPAGSRHGQKLRIRGKGRPGPLPGPSCRGDLYLQLVEKED